MCITCKPVSVFQFWDKCGVRAENFRARGRQLYASKMGSGFKKKKSRAARTRTRVAASYAAGSFNIGWNNWSGTGDEASFPLETSWKDDIARNVRSRKSSLVVVVVVGYTGLIVEIRANIYFPTVTNKPLCPGFAATARRGIGSYESFREIRLLDAFERSRAPSTSTTCSCK